MNIKIIRYANEGFKNYKQVINLNGEKKEIYGCYVFVKKVCKKALRVKIKKFLEDFNIIERHNHLKNELLVKDDIYVYARMFNVSDIYVVKCKEEISIQPESIWDNYDDSYKKVSLSELYNNILAYENLVKKLRKEAKENNKRFRLYNSEYMIYEAILDVNSIK